MAVKVLSYQFLPGVTVKNKKSFWVTFRCSKSSFIFQWTMLLLSVMLSCECEEVWCSFSLCSNTETKSYGSIGNLKTKAFLIKLNKEVKLQQIPWEISSLMVCHCGITSPGKRWEPSYLALCKVRLERASGKIA